MKPAAHIAVHCAYKEMCSPAVLRPHPKNPNFHSSEQIEIFAKVVKALGWRAPIVVSARSGLIIKGHGRLEVAKHLGLKEVPVDVQQYASEAEEWQDLLADNRIAELSERNDDQVKALLLELEQANADPTMTGYDAGAINKLLDRLAAQPPGEKEPAKDEAEKLQAKWKVKPGDLWQLGEHRIICGDSTAPATWERLMGDERARCCHTDPPYGVGYSDAAGTKIQGDGLRDNELAKLVREALALALAHSCPDAAFYIWHASSTRRDFEFALDQLGLVEKQYITWIKDSFVLGHADYQWQTEPCFYCEKSGQHAKWFGGRDQGTVWRIRQQPNDGTAMAIGAGLLLSDGDKARLFIRLKKPNGAKARHVRVMPDQPARISDSATSTAWEVTRDPRKDYLHPTQKPVELATIAVTNSSAPGDVVIDPFSGSGSTLLACEKTKRKARAIDIEPKFVAVALERWSQMTQEKPTKA